MIKSKINNALQSIKANHCFVADTVTGKEYTYIQCFGLAKYVSEKLLMLASDSVVVISENGYPLFVLYFACMFANITIIPIDSQKGEQEILDILDNHKNVPVICNSSKMIKEHDVYLMEEFFKCDIQNEISEMKLESIWSGIDLERVYMVTYTSGSTGKAKGVKHSLKNLFWSAISFGEKMNYGEHSVMCHVMPMTYMAGILNTILMPFIMHSKIVLFPRFSVISATVFWKNVIRYHVNTFWLSPTMLNILLTIDKKGETKEYFLHNSSIFSIGTAPLYPELKAAFEARYGIKLFQSYGLSETLFVTTVPVNSEVPDGSVGKLLEEVHLQFADDGEILIHVPWMYLGYSDKSKENYFSDDYYISGDFGEIKNNSLFITGRKKDLIVRGGMNISPLQIEMEINQYSDIQECCVAGFVINGEERTVCWYTTAISDSKKLEHQINTHLVQSLGKNYRIDYFKKVETIAKNLNGKVDRNAMKKYFFEDKFSEDK